VIRTLLLGAVAVLAACSGKPAEVTPPPAKVAPAAAPADAGKPPTAAIADDADCNLSTPLVPGIPGSPGHLIKSPRNPNGDSELSVLMRQFVDDLREVRTQAEAGQPVKKLLPVHRKMRCAWPTKPEERNEQYDGRAQGYLAAVRTFDGQPNQANYNAIIAGCIACHSVSCGGPLDFIDSMKWQ
jgi:hypothetical protein